MSKLYAAPFRLADGVIRMTNLYENFEEIDDELCLFMDEIGAIRGMLEEGRSEDALQAVKDLEERFEGFLEITDEDEPSEASEECQDGCGCEEHGEDCQCDECRQELSFDDAVCKSLDSIAEAIKSLDDRLGALERAVFGEEMVAEDAEGSDEDLTAEEPESSSQEEDGEGIWHKVGQLARQRS